MRFAHVRPVPAAPRRRAIDLTSSPVLKRRISLPFALMKAYGSGGVPVSQASALVVGKR